MEERERENNYIVTLTTTNRGRDIAASELQVWILESGMEFASKGVDLVDAYVEKVED